MPVFIVGLDHHGIEWDLVGVMTTEDAARKLCRTESHFYIRVETDVDLGDNLDPSHAEGAVYPLLDHEHRATYLRELAAELRRLGGSDDLAADLEVKAEATA